MNGVSAIICMSKLIIVRSMVSYMCVVEIMSCCSPIVSLLFSLCLLLFVMF